MENIAELRKICQSAFSREQANPWGQFIRIFSIYVTRALLPTKISANQVSVLMIIVGTFANILFLFPGNTTFLTGALLMQFWYMLDGVDGEVARYRHFERTGSMIMDKRDGSLSGMYIDMINHYIINFLLPFTVSFALFTISGSGFWILAGMIASLAQVLMLAFHDSRCRAQISQLKRFAYIRVNKPKDETKDHMQQRNRSAAHWIFIFLHHTLTYPAIMNTAGIAALFNYVLPIMEWRYPALLYWSIGTTIVVTTFITRVIMKKQTEEEFRNDFTVADSLKDIS